MISGFDSWIRVAEEIGVFQYLLPFLITFIVVYGVLEKLEPFGEGKRRVNVIFGVVIGLFVVGLAPGGVIGEFFSQFFGAVAVVMVGVLIALIVAGFVFGEDFHDSAWSSTLAAVAGLLVVAIFLWWGGLELIFSGSGYGIVGGTYIPARNLLEIAFAAGVIVLLFWTLAEEGS